MNETIREQTHFDFRDGHGSVTAHRHLNGGGWVADTAHVDDSVYVSPYARVYEYASVYGNVRIGNSAQVRGHATVRENACVSGNAVVEGNSLVEGSAILEGNSLICCGTHLKENIRIGGNTILAGTERCLGCPLLQETYGGVEESPCAVCMGHSLKRDRDAHEYFGAEFMDQLTEGKNYFFCTCGHSKKQPFCDGSHTEARLEPQEMPAGKTCSYRCKKISRPSFSDEETSKFFE